MLTQYPSKCLRCEYTRFEIVPADITDPNTHESMSEYFNFIRCARCKSVVGVSDLAILRKVNAIINQLGIDG
jgi:hypothetical protein